MDTALKRKAPNPNGNPEFKKAQRWANLGKTTVIRLPEQLTDLFTSLTTQISKGKVKSADLNQLCLDNDEISQELTAITGKPSLTIVPTPKNSSTELLEKLEQFEEFQKQSWGKFANQKGEFATNSPRWTKYNEFKAWLATQLP
jgi:hypothetical protein